MSKNKKKRKAVVPPAEDLRLDPEQRVTPSFDSTGIKLFRAPEQDEMGVRVLDNCAEEHQM